MGEVMTMLWYHGNDPQCKAYIEVFEFIYGTFDPSTETISMRYHQFDMTDYAREMHLLREAVQDLVKYLPVIPEVSHSGLVPRDPRLKSITEHAMHQNN
eukprot:435428_1